MEDYGYCKVFTNCKCEAPGICSLCEIFSLHNEPTEEDMEYKGD